MGFCVCTRSAVLRVCYFKTIEVIDLDPLFASKVSLWTVVNANASITSYMCVCVCVYTCPHPIRLSTLSVQQNDTDQVPSGPSFVVVVAIDFGTTSSGYAYAFTKEPECIHTMR